MTVGALVSATVTANVFVAVLARTSFAVHVTVVVPNGNVDPLDGLQVAATAPSTRSVADAVYVNAAPAGPVASSVAFGGTVFSVAAAPAADVASTVCAAPARAVGA